MKKRGQAAAFIIIGLALLLITGIVIAIQQDLFSKLFSKFGAEVSNVPEQIQPIQIYIDSCVTTLTQDAVTLVSLQGGYINLPKEQIPITPFTPLDKNLELIENSELKTAVWFRESANGIQQAEVPSKEIIEKEIASYIEKNFASCVNNLGDFAEQGFIVSAKAFPKATVKITDNKVTSSVDFPMDVQIDSIKFKLVNHIGDIDTNLGLLYNLATEIMEKENDEVFLENKTIDMLVAYDPEIPFTGTDLSCTDKIWLKDDVVKRLKNVLYENVAVMRVKGTNYVSNEKTKYMEFDALSSTNPDINVNFMYIPNWPTVVEINPSEGNILRSEAVNRQGGLVSAVASSFFCLNHHRFVYDIKYPVLISLKDSNGLVFQFATQVIIDNNEPRNRRKVELSLPDVESPVCDYPQKDVSIFTAEIDKNGELAPLTDVFLSFKCYPASCPLGKSGVNIKGETMLDITVPLCANGVIEASKEGYKQVRKLIYSSNENSSPDQIIVDLEKVYKKDVNVFVIDKSTGIPRKPYSSEQIVFQIKHKIYNYQTSFYTPSELNTIELLPGEYTIDSYLLRQASTYKFTIPKQTIENCIDTKPAGLFGFFLKDKICASTEVAPIEFDTMLTGGVLGAESEFTREELASSSPLNLYVLASDIPGSLEAIQKVQLELETNKDDRLFRKAEIA
jgi:hypothetical protein